VKKNVKLRHSGVKLHRENVELRKSAAEVKGRIREIRGRLERSWEMKKREGGRGSGDLERLSVNGWEVGRW
jgi:hypothetical protein